jgi:hypothetical protein
MGHRQPRSTVVSQEEATVVAFRRHTLLPLDDCLYTLHAILPHLTRSALHRCLKRQGINRLPKVEGDKPAKQKFKQYAIGYFHIDSAEVRTEDQRFHSHAPPTCCGRRIDRCAIRHHRPLTHIQPHTVRQAHVYGAPPMIWGLQGDLDAYRGSRSIDGAGWRHRTKG